MKILITLLLLISHCITQANIKVEVQFSYSANYFDLMDNVSNWWEGFTEPQYQIEWQKRNGPLTEVDKKFFGQYKTLREKYYNDPDQKEKDPTKNRNGLFSRLGAIEADPIAEAFYDSQSLDESFQKTSKILTKEEVDLLRKFYVHFQPAAANFLKESEAFNKIIPTLRKSLSGKKIAQYFSEVAAFYNVQPKLVYKVLLVWFPPIKRSNASPTGKYLVMRYNPIEDLEMAQEESEIAFHEIVHSISSQQSLAQKQKLTQDFLNICSVKDRLKALTILEEPLAVVFGQAIYLEKFNPKKLDLVEPLYNNPWISSYAKLLLPIAKDYLKFKKNINQGFIQKAALVCEEFVSASKMLAPITAN